MRISSAIRRACLGLFAGTGAFSVFCSQAATPPDRTPADLSRLEAQAPNGTRDDKLELAIAYDLGQGAPRNPALAADWYRQAAALGAPEAELRLGMLAETGDGVTQSYLIARGHYERALSLGLPEANLRLGILYLEGWGIPRDPAEALARIRRAAEADYRPAQRVLSDIYAVGLGLKADRQEALVWAQRAARADDPAAQVSVGLLLLNRLSREADLKLAREWYQLSVEQEYTRGMLALASTFFRPGVTAEDRAIGRGWLQLAAEGGNSAAAFYLAGDLLLGTPRDESAALTWLEQAARDGEASAREVLELASGGRPVADAFKYVMTVPQTVRYVSKQNAKRNQPADPSDPTSQIPLVIKMTEPVYPMAMRLTRTTGQVVVDFIVDTSGRVRNPTAVKTTHPAFSERAVEAVRAWRFSPGVKNGRVVNTHMQVPVIFTLSDVHAPHKPRTESESASPPGNP
ncbi:MAG TPA: TonB family protein [Opitutaceae bacterium]|nr:TonB family protein [Opitutaceae bacterium]